MNTNEPWSEQWLKAADAWVDAEAAAKALEDTKSAVFSQMILRQGDLPISRAEVMVRASQEWAKHLEAIGRARTAANKAEVRKEFMKLKFMEWNSQAATERTAARL